MTAAEPVEAFIKAVGTETWEVFRKNALVFVLASILQFFLTTISLGLIAGPLFVGYIDLVRRASRHEYVQVTDIFRGFEKFWPSFLASIVVGIAAFIGTLLLFVPGLVVILFTAYTFQVIAAENLPAIAAITRSAKLVREHLLNTLLLLIIVAVVQSIGGSVLLGLLLTSPLSLIALTLAYERIAKQSLAEASFVPGTP